METAGDQTPLGRPKTIDLGRVKTHSVRPQLRKTCWTPPRSNNKQYLVSSVTRNRQDCQNELDHLPSVDDSHPKCLTRTNTSTKHLKASNPAPITSPFRCLLSQKGITCVPCLNQGSAREIQENKPSSANPVLANGTEGKMPWYLTVIHEKEQRLLQLGEEITRLSEFETQCARKDNEILVLQEKLTEVTNQLHLTCNDEVITAQAELILRLGEEVRHLHRVEEEVLEKSELIIELRKEIQMMKQPSPQWETAADDSIQLDRDSMLSETELHSPQDMVPETQPENLVRCGTENTMNAANLVSMTERMRELERTNETLKKELEEIRTDYMISTGTVCSLRRTLSAREGELATVKDLVEELRNELRDRLEQLQAMSRKFSCLREGKANEEVLATLESENYALRQLTEQLKEDVSQKDQEVAQVTSEVQQLQRHLVTATAVQTALKREGRASQEMINCLQLQHNKTKMSLEQMQYRFDRLRMKIIQAVFSAPGAKQPQVEISDSALLETMQKIIDDRTTFYQRLQQKGEKVPPLTIPEMQNMKTAVTSPKKN